jgi:hypothetical protein
MLTVAEDVSSAPEQRWRATSSWLLLGGAVDAAATGGEVVDSQLHDLPVRVEPGRERAGGGVGAGVSETG